MRRLDKLRVLVLNSDFIPNKVIGWQDAVTSVYSKKSCFPVDFYDLKIKDGKGIHYVVPAVIARKRYVKRSTKVKCSRKNVILRDHLTCQYCGHRFPQKELNLDHVIPRSRWKGEGSPTNFLNLVAACYPCNRKKGNKTADESGMHPLHPPHIPNKIELTLGITPWSKVPKEWGPYLKNFKIFEDLQYEE